MTGPGGRALITLSFLILLIGSHRSAVFAKLYDFAKLDSYNKLLEVIREFTEEEITRELGRIF